MIEKELIPKKEHKILLFESLCQKYNLTVGAIFGKILDLELYGEHGEFRGSLDFLASKLGLSYATVLRAIKVLTKENLIKDTTPETKRKQRTQTKHYKTNQIKLIEISNEFDKTDDEYNLDSKLEYEKSLEYLNPILSKEWLKSTNDLSPRNVREYSTENVYWRCKNCSHQWWTIVANRSGGRDCPKCALLLSESKIANQLKEYISKKYVAKLEYKIFRNPKTNRCLPYDIYLPDSNIFIEIHGLQHYIFVKHWHRDIAGFEYSQYKDEIKKEYAEKNGIYIEIDLRKIKAIEEAIDIIEELINKDRN